MKVVFLNRYFHPDHSATSQMLSDLAFFLSGAGHDVAVITSRQRYDDPAATLPPEETIGGVRVVRVATTRFGRDNLVGRAADYATFYAAAARALAKIVERGDIVVAKTDPPLISVVAGAVARRRGARLVNWVQDLFPEVAHALGVRALRGPQVRVLRAARDRALANAAANVVVGTRMGEVVTRAGASPSTLSVIHNWSDADAIRPIAAADNPLRRAWGLEGAFVACYSGNMGRAHEFETIIGAAERLANLSHDERDGHAPPIRFLFIGGGPQRRAVEASATARGLANVSFRPYQSRDDLSQSLSAGDVHLVSLRPELEGYIVPSKLYGILAAGRPTLFIGDPSGEVARIVAAERIGYVVEQGDAAGLADRLRLLARDQPLRDEMGARARALLRDRFDRRIALATWRTLLEDLHRGAVGADRGSAGG